MRSFYAVYLLFIVSCSLQKKIVFFLLVEFLLFFVNFCCIN